MSGKVYIASMNMRGKWADSSYIDNYIKINVTSAQGKTNKNRLSFSPMTEIQGGYKGYWNFESYWQSGKVFEDIPIEKTKKYWSELKEAKRRYPNLTLLIDGILDTDVERRPFCLDILQHPLVKQKAQELVTGEWF